MPRTILVLGVCFLLLANFAGSGQEKTDKKDKPDSELYKYMPLKVGIKWHYRSGDAKIVVHCERKEKIEFTKMNEKGEEVTVKLEGFYLKATSGDNSLTELVGVTDEGVFRFRAAGKEITPPLPILQGTDSWAFDGMTEKTPIVGKFTRSKVKVEFAGKMVDAYHVSGKDVQIGADKIQIDYWFSPGYGIVRHRTKVGDGKDIVLVLENIEVEK